MPRHKQPDRDNIDRTIDDYLVALKVRCRPKSVDRATYSLNHFKAFCQQHGLTHLKQLTRSVLRTFVLELRETKPWSHETVWTVTSTVKAFLRWCDREGIYKYPLREGDFPAKSKYDPKPLDEQEVQRLVQAASGKNWWDKRNVAILMTLLATGCRRSELLQMKVGDVERGYSVVVQKGGTNHYIHFTQTAIAAITDYLIALRRFYNLKLDPDMPLWWSIACRPLSENGVQMIFKHLSQRTGIKVWCHRLRHTSATLRLAQGASTEVVRQALGHRSPNAVLHYSRLAEKDKHDILEETDPARRIWFNR